MTRLLHGDPLELLLSVEEQTCKGCIYVGRLWGREVCTVKRPSFPERCGKYLEIGGGGGRRGQG